MILSISSEIKWKDFILQLRFYLRFDYVQIKVPYHLKFQMMWHYIYIFKFVLCNLNHVMDSFQRKDPSINYHGWTKMGDESRSSPSKISRLEGKCLLYNSNAGSLYLILLGMQIK